MGAWMQQAQRVRRRVYSIGIFTGPSPLALSPPDDRRSPVLTRECITDHLAEFVADPFMIRADGSWHMFFEVLSWRPGSRKGEIAHATSSDGLDWTYRGVVLAEPFHLSFPYVFAAGSDHYLVPESAADGSVRLYRADPFPRRWKLVGTLARGGRYLDNCVFERDGRWWMLTHTDAAGTLRLFHAPELSGPWSEHARSPVVRADPRIARPAGRVVSSAGRLFRFAQDCRGTYGSSVAALEITRLTPSEFDEVEVEGNPILRGSGAGWNDLGMHHVDAHELEPGRWIACVDGWTLRVRRPREIARWALDHLRRERAS